MAEYREVNRKDFVFTAPNGMADAIDMVAAETEGINAIVAPITTPKEAVDALALVIQRANKRLPNGWEHFSASNRNAVAGRYIKLGENGTDSVVFLQVPEGAQNFDFKTFYERVSEVL